MAITTWQDAKATGLSQEALQELCDYDLQLLEKIKERIKRKHPQASDKQIDAWGWGALRRKFKQEHWGWCPY